MPSQTTFMIQPIISFRKESYRSFRARCKKTNTSQSQENLPCLVSSVPLTVLETKLWGACLCPKALGCQLATFSNSFYPGKPHSFGLLTMMEKKLIQTSKASSIKNEAEPLSLAQTFRHTFFCSLSNDHPATHAGDRTHHVRCSSQHFPNQSSMGWSKDICRIGIQMLFLNGFEEIKSFHLLADFLHLRQLVKSTHIYHCKKQVCCTQGLKTKKYLLCRDTSCIWTKQTELPHASTAKKKKKTYGCHFSWAEATSRASDRLVRWLHF